MSWSPILENCRYSAERFNTYQVRDKRRREKYFQLMMELDKHLGSKKDSITFWGKLSED
jgi:hypothetical protein